LTRYAMAMLALLGGALAWSSHDARKHVERLAAENKELRLRHSARERWKGLKEGTVDVNTQAVMAASYNLGAPQSLLTAVRLQEHGSTLWEFGHQGKTAWIAACIPPDQWQAHEAARTLNKALWRHTWGDPIRRREAIKALGKAYTAEKHAKQWARNVDKLEKQTND